MNIYQFAKKRGLITDLDITQTIHGMLGESGHVSDRAMFQAKKRLEKMRKQARKTRELYQQATESGEIEPEREKTYLEKIIETANGDPNSESTSAARRLLKKKYKLFEYVEPGSPFPIIITDEQIMTRYGDIKDFCNIHWAKEI